MAPPVVPTEVKRRRGTLRKDRTAGPLVPIAGATSAPPPASLGAAGVAEWKHALATCSWIAMSDLLALRLLCEAIDKRETLAAELRRDGVKMVLTTSTGYDYVNPLVGAIDKIEDRIMKWNSLLGKTPSDRSKLGVAEVKTASILDDLAARRAAKSGDR